MTKKLVELHDNKIIVESREDEGSRFEIVIPHRLCDSAPLPVNAEEPESADKSIDNEEIKNMRILVCEDNDDLRRFMKRPLGRHFNVATASNGVDAWEYIKKELPDLIVSDIMMPGMDGFELCRLVKSTFETSHIPIILLSALSDQSDELHGLGLGADDYMTKPFDMKTLTQRIMSIILNRRALGSRVISEVGETVEEADTKESNELNDAFVRQALKIVVNHLEDSDFSKEEFARNGCEHIAAVQEDKGTYRHDCRRLYTKHQDGPCNEATERPPVQHRRNSLQMRILLNQLFQHRIQEALRQVTYRLQGMMTLPQRQVTLSRCS